VWDIRISEGVRRTIAGPHICGDSLDLKVRINYILAVKIIQYDFQQNYASEMNLYIVMLPNAGYQYDFQQNYASEMNLYIVMLPNAG